MDIWLIRIRCSTSSHLVLVQVTDFMPLPSCCIENIYTFSICTKTIYYSVNFALIFLIITTVKLCPSLLMNSVSYFPEIFSSCCCWVWLKVLIIVQDTINAQNLQRIAHVSAKMVLYIAVHIITRSYP